MLFVLRFYSVDFYKHLFAHISTVNCLFHISEEK